MAKATVAQTLVSWLVSDIVRLRLNLVSCEARLIGKTGSMV